MLADVGLLTDEERSVIHAAVDRVELELNEGTFAFAPTDEDIHTAIERRVTEIAGGTGAKLHTGRSRNDQVALDLRLYVRREGRDQVARIDALQQVLLRRANDTTEVALPGFTHLQRAQPVLLAHHLLARLLGAGTRCRPLARLPCAVDVSPLGAGARRIEPAARPDLRRGRARLPTPVPELARRGVAIATSSPKRCSSRR